MVPPSKRNIMQTIDCQQTYWNSVAHEKKFSHSIEIKNFFELVPKQSKILDYGCGYGRTCDQLSNKGYYDVVGIDIALEMIKRGKSLNPELNLQHFNGSKIPFADNTFHACSLLAVLTCIPTNNGQTKVIDELTRVLKSNGILYLSDYPLQKDERNIKRYKEFEYKYHQFGVFQLPDGGVLRHNEMPWIYELLQNFIIIDEKTIQTSTMNGNKAEIFQILARKK